ncbi:NAD(P)/FAD-dependent oxidoreductase [Chloroflexota bacterium]
MNNNQKNFKYLIIGNSAGGIGAVEGIRTYDRSGSIAVVSDEPYHPYSRPLIAKYLGQSWDEARIHFRDISFFQENAVETFLDSLVKKLDTTKRQAVLENGMVIGWEKLLLATGGTPIKPPIPGMSKKFVFTFTTFKDAKAIKSRLESLKEASPKAIIIGGGLIGLSAAEALQNLGVQPTILEMQPRILGNMVDATTADRLNEAITGKGIPILTGCTVVKIGEIKGKAVVHCDDGTAMTCDLIIMAAGVRPRTEIAKGTQIKTNRGFSVDKHMETSVPDVYACGDAAEPYDYIYEESRPTPVWPNAYIGGRTAGYNMAGKVTEYPLCTSLNSLDYFGQEVVSAGIVTAPEGFAEIFQEDANTYRKIIVKDGLIYGLVMAGNIRNSGIIYHLMKDRVDVSKFQNKLILPEFSLASLPASLWKEKLTPQRANQH